MRRLLDVLADPVLVALLGLAAIVGMLGWRVDELAGRVAALEARPAVQRIAVPSTPAAVPVSTAAARPCPAAACLTVPYRSSAYGPGTAGLGLLITGSHGYGGTSLRLDDYEHAPEGYFRLGSWFVVERPHWVGGAYCIVGIPARPLHPPLSTWRSRCLTWRLLGRLIARFGR